jgi:hypothetical protein
MAFQLAEKRLRFVIFMGFVCSSLLVRAESNVKKTTLPLPAKADPSLVLQLTPVTVGDYAVGADVICGASSAVCEQLIEKGTLCIGRSESTCSTRAFVPSSSQNGRWQLHFNGEPVRADDAIWFQYSQGQRSNTVHGFPAAGDVSVSLDCSRNTVKFIFPVRQRWSSV